MSPVFLVGQRFAGLSVSGKARIAVRNAGFRRSNSSIHNRFARRSVWVSTIPIFHDSQSTAELTDHARSMTCSCLEVWLADLLRLSFVSELKTQVMSETRVKVMWCEVGRVLAVRTAPAEFYEILIWTLAQTKPIAVVTRQS